MWFVVILVVAIIVFVIVKKKADDRRAKEEQERRAAEARARIANLETLTENEKNAIAKQSEYQLEATLRAFEKAKSGDAQAMTMLGLTYNLKLNNASKSFHWIEKASKAGGVDATYWLGKYYLHGYGVKEDTFTGTHYVLEAATKGNKDAINCLSTSYGLSKEEMRDRGIPV